MYMHKDVLAFFGSEGSLYSRIMESVADSKKHIQNSRKS